MRTTAGTAVLLVEDEPQLRNLYRRVLESDHLAVMEAGDGEAALTLIEERADQFGLVITDITMPGVDGRELAEMLSIFHPELPVLAMSADPGQADRRLPTLIKPFALKHLIEAARLMLHQPGHMRGWAAERRLRARQARQISQELRSRNSESGERANLVAVALELQHRARR